MSKYHYVYRITNTKEQKHYYGVRSSKVAPKLDLGIKYFSSSSDRDFIKEQKENPQDYKYKVINIFSTRVEAINLEIKLHSKFNVVVNESFYNKSKQTSSGFDTSGKGNYIDENGKIILISRKEALLRGLNGCTTGYIAWNKGLKMSEEYNIKLKNIILHNRRSYVGEGNPNYGKPVSDETKEKIRQGNLGKTLSNETKEKMSISRSGELHWNYGKTHSEETKEKMRKPKSDETKQKMKEAKLNSPIRICTHCGREGRGGNMTRYHFDNCKRKG